MSHRSAREDREKQVRYSFHDKPSMRSSEQSDGRHRSKHDERERSHGMQIGRSLSASDVDNMASGSKHKDSNSESSWTLSPQPAPSTESRREEAEPTRTWVRKSAFARSSSLSGSSFSRSAMQAKAKADETYTFPGMAVTRPNRTTSAHSSESEGASRNETLNAMHEEVYWPYYNCFCELQDVELDKLKSDSLAFRDFLLSKPGGKYSVNAGILRHGRADNQEQDVIVVGREGKPVRLVDIRDACVQLQKIPFVPKVTYSRSMTCCFVGGLSRLESHLSLLQAEIKV